MGTKVKTSLTGRGIVLSVMKECERKDMVSEIAANVFANWNELFGNTDIHSERAVAEVSSAQITCRGLKIQHILIERGKEKECLEEFRKEAGIAEDKFIDVLEEMRKKEGVWIEV